MSGTSLLSRYTLTTSQRNCGDFECEFACCRRYFAGEGRGGRFLLVVKRCFRGHEVSAAASLDLYKTQAFTFPGDQGQYRLALAASDNREPRSPTQAGEDRNRLPRRPVSRRLAAGPFSELVPSWQRAGRVRQVLA